VLGADVVVPELPRLALSDDNHLPGAIGEPLKH
jgi:hypothetical protein